MKTRIIICNEIAGQTEEEARDFYKEAFEFGYILDWDYGEFYKDYEENLFPNGLIKKDEVDTEYFGLKELVYKVHDIEHRVIKYYFVDL